MKVLSSNKRERKKNSGAKIKVAIRLLCIVLMLSLLIPLASMAFAQPYVPEKSLVREAQGISSAASTGSSDNSGGSGGSAGGGSTSGSTDGGTNGTGGSFPNQDALPYADDSVIIKLASNPRVRSAPSVPSVPSDFGVEYTEMHMLNPSAQIGYGDALFSMSLDSGNNNVFVLTLADTGREAVEQALAILNANPAIELAEPDYYLESFAVPNDPGYYYQDSWRMIKSPIAWDITTGSKSIVVGVIDSGIYSAHEDIVENMWINPNPNQNGYIGDFHGYSFTTHSGSDALYDSIYHGTSVASILGAKGNNGIGMAGVCWDVQIASLRVSDNSGVFRLSAVLEAINYAEIHAMPITNNSYGTTEYSQIFEEAVSNYSGLFVVSSGNEGSNNDITPLYPASFDLPNVISVASIERDGSLSGFSNYGVGSVHLAAPGSYIYSAYPTAADRYDFRNGTSFAAPFVTGVAALIMSIRPDWTPEQVKTAILATVEPKGIPVITGGMLDAGAALLYALDTHKDFAVSLASLETDVNKGDVIYVDVIVSSDEEIGFMYMQTKVFFDSSKLSLSPLKSSYSDEVMLGDSNGVVTVIGSEMNAVFDSNGSYTVATLAFDVLTAANESVEFSLDIDPYSTMVGIEGLTDYYAIVDTNPVSVMLHNITVTFEAGTGAAFESAPVTAYVRYNEAGLFESDAYDTALLVPAVSPMDGYGLEEPVWSDGANFYTADEIAAMKFTQSSVFTAQAFALYTYTIEFIDFGVYRGAPMGFKVVIVCPDFSMEEDCTLTYDSGAAAPFAMYWSVKYDGYVWFVGDDDSEEDVISCLRYSSGTSVSIAYDGDVNRNRRVNVQDAQIVHDLFNNRLLDGFSVLGMLERLEADINGDGVVNTIDAQAIMHIILGI